MKTQMRKTKNNGGQSIISRSTSFPETLDFRCLGARFLFKCLFWISCRGNKLGYCYILTARSWISS